MTATYDTANERKSDTFQKKERRTGIGSTLKIDYVVVLHLVDIIVATIIAEVATVVVVVVVVVIIITSRMRFGFFFQD